MYLLILIDVLLHVQQYYLSMQNMLEQGPDHDFWCWFDTTQFSYISLCSPKTCKYVFNPNVTTFQSKCAKGLHFSAFILFKFRSGTHGLNKECKYFLNIILQSYQKLFIHI